MSNTKYYIAFLALVALLAPAGIALAADLNYNADTVFQLTSPSTINLTVTAGSVATSLTVNAGNVQVTIPANSQFAIKSPSKNLNVSGASSTSIYTLNCTTESVAIATVNTSSTAETITFTPTALQCAGGGGGGGSGGGGGGGSSPAPSAPSVPSVPEAPATPSAPDTPASPTPAPAGAHSNGTLILDADGTIYVVKNGKRVGFRNPEEYFSHGYRFEQAVPASATDRSLPLDTGLAGIEKALDGTLALDKSDGRTIYMVAGGKKRGFISADVFFALGYKFEQAVPIDLTDYEAGYPVDSPTPPHPNGALVLDKNDGRTVWWILNETRQGFQSAEVFQTYGFDFGKIVPANDADMALPEGSLVKFRDGTLVLDGGTYYLITDGKKAAFASAATLQAKGYKLQNVISGSLSSYALGPAIE